MGIENHLLGQGTIYPDTIETGSTKRSDTIKTHHNRVPIIEQMIAEGGVIEPLADLYKVEVRELGERLGISHAALCRHPFPGPGLGVRLLCGDGRPDSIPDEVVPQMEKLAGGFGLQALALPIRSVGVKADLRVYEHPIMLSGEVPWDTLLDAASAITADVPGINRCIWNLALTHPGFARPLAATMTRVRLDLLREADHMVMDGLERHGLYQSVWQCPTVMVPVEMEGGDGELIVLRPIHSQRAMTAAPVQLPSELLSELRDSIMALNGVSSVALDITSKPPGTIEWE